MSSHPFTPQPFVEIDIRSVQVRHHRGDPTILVILVLTLLSAGVLGGLSYFLAGRTPDPVAAGGEQLSDAMVAVDHPDPAADPEPIRDFSGTKIPLAAGFPDLNDLQAWEVKETEGLFESDAAIAPRNTIDEHVFGKLAELEIQPAQLCSDATFLRRVYLDLIGTLPTVDEAQRFLEDGEPSKREKLIDELLRRPEFADYWAMKWCDILRVKAEFPINLWPNAAQGRSAARAVRRC